jgi:DNA (cytosine-5)-methyltransferase 1
LTAYYNEIEPYAAEWLRNLIKAGHIPHGEVDTRSIVDVSPYDLRGYTQCHFFAGIGGWGLALRLAGWPDDRPIWTGSCPCQPFSVAGKGAGVDDPRHLWPHFHRLIAACRPPVVMGEQVAGAAGYGWLDGVRADLETENYASRGVDIPACSVDAPHIRQRLYWVASDMGNANNTGPQGHGELVQKHDPKGRQEQTGRPPKTGVDDMVNPERQRLEGAKFQRERLDIKQISSNSSSDHMADASDERRQGVGLLRDGRSEVPEASGSGAGHMAHADDTKRRQDGAGGDDDHRDQAGRDEDASDAGACDKGDVEDSNGIRWLDGKHTKDGRQTRAANQSGGGDGSFWFDHIWLTGADGKSRRSKPGLPLLAHGIPNRVGRLRAYGNAIVPPLAAEVIKAYMETQP